MRVALITGAGSGIGLATARVFLDSGVAVVGVGRSPDKLASLNAAAGDLRDLVATLAIDATLDDAPERSVGLAMSRFGRLDYLVNNAGVGSPKPVHETDDAMLDASLNLMLRAPFRYIRQALTVMEPGSSIVNVSSVASRLGAPNEYVDYAASKGALDTFTIGLSKEVAGEGIRVNAVRPGYIYTDFHALSGDPDRVSKLESAIPMARGGRPDEVAEAIVWLLSDKASYATGTFVDLGGGR